MQELPQDLLKRITGGKSTLDDVQKSLSDSAFRPRPDNGNTMPLMELRGNRR